MINPAEIPQIPGDMAALGQHATAVSGVGTAFPDTGARVHSTWQGLAPVYVAPESAQLFAATGPVQSVSASVGEDLTAVGGALDNYATEVTAIKARLEALRAQATTFVDGVANDDDWQKDQGKVDEHNQLLSDVNGAVADFMDAQRRCANAILSRYSDKRYTAENGDGTVTDTEFGYTKDVFDAALTQGDGLPWGKPEEHDRGFLGDVGAFFVGVKDGAVGFVEGLGALIGYSDGHWSWGTAGTAWKGLGTFALALSAPYLIPLNQATDLPGLPKGTLGNTLLGAGKSLIAYDTWKEDKSKAAGEATFNIVSAIVGTKGAGAGLRGAGAAAEASRFATVAKVGAGAVKAGEFITKLPKVSDVVLNTIKKFPGFKLPHIELPHTDIPTTHIDPPHIDASGAHVPAGPSVGDGVGNQHALPPAATITHDGVVDGRSFHEPAAHTPTPSIGHDGVIGGHPRVDTPAAPAPHGADAPVHNAEPLPPGATITDRGIVPGGHGGGPLADAGGGIHIDQDGVIRGGSPADAPVPHGADAAGGAPVHGSGTPAAPTPHGADAPVTPAPHGADSPVTPTPHGADTGAAPAPHAGDAAGTPAPHGAGTPAAPATHGADTPATPGAHGPDAPVHNTEPLPPGATITDRGIVPGGHGSGPLADAGAGIHIDRDGVIRPGTETPVPHGADATGPAAHGGGTPATPTPHGADAPATPGRHSADAPVHNAEPLPPGATITDRGIVPGGHGSGPLADAGAGIHIDRDGVIRPGAHADAPPPHTPQEPALVGAGERPLVQDGVIGGDRGGHIENAAGGATHLPGHDPLIRDGVIGGGRGIDHTPPAVHGEPGRPGGVHPPEPPRGGRLPEDPAAHPHEPGGTGHDPADRTTPHEPTPHEPGAHDPGTPHDGAGHDGGTHDGAGHDGAGHDPGSAPPREMTPQELADVESRRSDVVNHNQQEYDQLSIDSDQGGRVTNNSREEAGTLLDMRETGALPDDVRRPTDVNSGDAVTGSPPHEVHYDIKHERDSWPPQANKPPGEPFPPKAGGYSTAAFENKLIEQIVQKQRVVIIDTRGLKQTTIDDMHNLVATHGWENNVIWYP